MRYSRFCFLLMVCLIALCPIHAQSVLDDNSIVTDTVVVATEEEDDYEDEDYEDYSEPVTPASQLYDNDSITIKPFDKKNWKKVTENTDYSEEHEEEKEDGKSPSFNMPSLPFQIGSQFVKVALVSVLVLAGLFVLFLIFKDARWLNRKKHVEVEDLSNIDIENELPEKEQLRKLMQDAVKKGDLKTAIRYYYLMVIAHYRTIGYIKWKKDKTNSQYLREMSKHALYTDMKSATNIFERTWYGDVVVDSNMFEQAETIFNKLLNHR